MLRLWSQNNCSWFLIFILLNVFMLPKLKHQITKKSQKFMKFYSNQKWPILKTSDNPWKWNLKKSVHTLDLRNLAISEMFRVYFFLRIYMIYIKDSTFVKRYITLSVCKNLFYIRHRRLENLEIPTSWIGFDIIDWTILESPRVCSVDQMPIFSIAFSIFQFHLS